MLFRTASVMGCPPKSALVDVQRRRGLEVGGGELTRSGKGWRSLERQEGLKERLDVGRQVGEMVAAGEEEGEGGWWLKPNGSQAKAVSPIDNREFGGGV